LFGAVGASGDSSDNDERVVLAGMQAAGLIGDPGADWMWSAARMPARRRWMRSEQFTKP